MKKFLAVWMSIILMLTFAVPGYAELKKGSKGNDVVALQERLIELGYLDGAADGIFGNMTKGAVESYQKANSLDVTGVATIKDINVLFSDKAKACENDKSVTKSDSVFHNADYESYNSLASKNGLEGDLLRLYGVINQYIQKDGASAFILRQSDEKEWLITTGYEGKIDGSAFQGYQGQEVEVFCIYQGFSGVYSLPAADIGTYGGLLVVNSNEIISTSTAKTLMEDKGVSIADIVAKSNAPTHMDTKEMTNDIQSSPEKEHKTTDVNESKAEDQAPAANLLDSVSILDSDSLLEIKEAGYAMDNGYLLYSVILHNRSNEKAIKHASFRFTSRDANGALLGTGDQMVGTIYPGQDYVWAGLAYLLDEIPAKVEFEAIAPEDYSVTSASTLPHPIYAPLEVVGINRRKNRFLGEVYNPNDYTIDSVAVILVFRDEKGSLLGGNFTFIDSVKPGAKVPFDLDISERIVSNSYKIYANPW